ncbi:3,4-dihydroxy 2-butanone 4-phosphate synthase/GTP cyclohydrolase II [Streptomyces sp. SAI-208]|uniref:GTP cyclohydrolase II n=1 Tax=unclassified Streptomyces TaxID=2593676 RepID=UPI0024734577|nr:MULTISPECIES: GTP cyclohydrolase II [unclassified Streptomyces]MDH6515338.1 3,4-dihydroxy 2-butanone 4-phosphate synthase/GTP cyclohydrolase II [Streptomyces sp. SAI-090]MDH6547551.1 3,4-dihydroxy 2-butanone 4-phosphate synthase/GTP cyclohydrolase II [Streptomyces sp. SAI-041]MDH6566636.1 3,4-dihydroxy 2-butanone 4-phosphate synthase/GTP cyclohydrolase II [Streptomyces sp. SAI-117]MDH6588425.1 3,4-dihydroxy 2-butanone 4-phosphate synthase/GTP cyclohydrolase II [Streptomyces sp. SAI-133]MDH6
MTDKVGVLGKKAPQRTGVERVVNAPLPTVYGKFQAVGYLDHDRGDEQVALVHGDIGSDDVLVRLHSECLTGDAFGSQHCECGDQLDAAMRAVVKAGSGIVVYLRGHEGRGIGLLAKLRAMALQAEGLDTVEANLALGLPVDSRDYGVAAGIFHDLGVNSVRLMSNNPRKREALQRHGIQVTETVPLLITPCESNITYLRTKRERMDHHLPHLDAVAHLS